MARSPPVIVPTRCPITPAHLPIRTVARVVTDDADYESVLASEDKRPLMAPTVLSGTKRGKGSRAGKGSTLPPSLMTTVSGSHTYRFVSSSNVFLTITAKNILESMGGIALTTTTFVPWTSAFRVHHFTAWSASSASGADTPALYWGPGTASQVPDEERITTIPQGVALSRALRFVPPKSSLASDWITSAVPTAVVLYVKLPVGTVIDMLVSFRLSNVVVPLAAVAVVGASAGSVYYPPLDGPLGTLTPQGLTPI